MQSNNMDWEWLLKEFFLQITINLFCLLICVIGLFFYFYQLNKITPPIPTTPIPYTFEYEEELGQIKVDILAISSDFASAKKLKTDQDQRVLENKEI